jgi:hypothetical protein
MKNKSDICSKLAPVFSSQSPDDVVSEILRDDESVRMRVIDNPRYREFLKKLVVEENKKYKGPVYWGGIIDKWDRVTSAAGMAAELVVGPGTAASALEEIPEMIPKAIYSLYYVTKTGDWKAIPYWGAAEAASFLPFGIGDLIDWSNIYLNRAKKKMKQSVTKRFKAVAKMN